MPDEYYAHTDPDHPGKGPDEPGVHWQPLEDHLRQTAELARGFAGAWKADDWGYLAGLWHDIGKYSTEFQRRLHAAGGENAHVETTGRVDHSTAGAQYAYTHLGHEGKVLAYVIAGHHGGLPDGVSTDSCLRSRLEKCIPDYSNCPSLTLKATTPTLTLQPTTDRAGIQFTMFIRMLYSCLVDADFVDTEAFMAPQRGQRRHGYKPLRELEAVFFAKLGQKRKAAAPSPVNLQRELILGQCLKASEQAMGIFSLTVPTGGGKTLSSMAFALKHAMQHNLKRIIYVIPFTSIIEQNAQVFRSMLGDEAVLEHHSNFEPLKEDCRSRLAAENWDAPVIVTTNVQFFESLFANRSSRCRKLHNMAQSVIILDEVQTLPASYLLPCLEVLRELTRFYKSSVVLCSATQPAVQKRSDFARGLENVKEIIDDPQTLAMALKRVNVSLLSQTPDTDLVALLHKSPQILCVVNTRKHARTLYEAMGGTSETYHLSALMCPVHRSAKLAQIRQLLAAGSACRVISTQLIEAGVDIDFPVVMRSLAGIDSIAQAAGRCNREGKLDHGDVFVFTPETGVPAGHFRQTAQAAESVARRYAVDILSLEAIEEYFKLYYWTKGDALDEEGILTILQAGCQKGDFPFKSVAEKFQFIREYMKPVVIPFDDEARSLIRSLDYTDHPAAFSRRLQKYTVSISPWQWEKLLSNGSIEVKAGLFPVLVDEGLYRQDTGLCADSPAEREPESLYV
jgi:CRISPR-associated endonuclease/helicase Cas3